MAHSKKENRDERLKAELQRTANRKVPKKAAIGAAVGLLVCIVVIATVAIALGGSGRIASLEAGDVPALASIEGDEVALPDPIDADQVAYLRISNYPNLSFEEPGPALTSDRQIIARACDLLSGARFLRWDGYESYREEQMNGGFSSGLRLLDADGNTLMDISYLPGTTLNGHGAPGEGVCTILNDACCVMEGDQSAMSDFIQECVDSALAEYADDGEGASSSSASTDSRTWVSAGDFEEQEAQHAVGQAASQAV